jgi:hypothetical protein
MPEILAQSAKPSNGGTSPVKPLFCRKKYEKTPFLNDLYGGV